MPAKKTIKRSIQFSGTGIHSGKFIDLHIEPSDSGKIIFQRSDIPGFSLPADAQSTEARSSTVLVHKGQVVQTVEHLMAAFFLLEIDSACVIVDGPEIPSADGSAAPFIRRLREAGVKELSQPKVTFNIIRPFSLRRGEGVISGFPDSHTCLAYEIDFDHPLIGRQKLTLKGESRNWIDDIAPARTFGFLKDADMMRKQKLALGSSLKNTLVLDDNDVINGPLRFKDEFVRHKLLDLIGDLSLLGGSLKGRIQADKAGHALHLQTVRYLLTHPEVMKRLD